jgi:thiol:disulfide interchange protein
MDNFVARKNQGTVIIILSVALLIAVGVAVYYYRNGGSSQKQPMGTLSSSPQDVGQERIYTSKPALVLYRADWCGNCTAMKDEWAKAARLLNDGGVIEALDFESSRDKDEISKAVAKYKGMGYPHIRFFPEGYGDGKPSSEFLGPRTEQAFVAFAHKSLYSATHDEQTTQQTPV